MKHLFYFFTIAPILWETMNVLNPIKTHAFLTRIKNNSSSYDHRPRTEKDFMKCMLLYIIWVFIGLFTFQWPVFLTMFVLGFLPKKNILFRWCDAFITLILLGFCVLNEYHFKINVYEFLKLYLTSNS